MENRINTLNLKLENELNTREIPIGLFSGKMGVCIYLYRLGRLQNNNKFYKHAEKLLDEVFNEVNKIDTIDIENGLLGISLGINYLIRNNYIQGDENTIFEDVDDRIFKYSSFNQGDKDISVLIQILYYIYIRQQSSLSKEINYLFDELSAQIINTLHAKIEFILNDSVASFSIDSKFPLFLFILSKIYQNNTNKDKITRIVQEIIPLILSRFESTHSKRLHLLWGVSKINSQIKDKRLSIYCDILASHIHIDSLVEEFPNKNVFIKNGIAGIYLLISSLEENEKQKIDVKSFYIKCKQKIEDSLIWKLYDNDEYFNNHAGLTGYCGAVTVWNMIYNQYER